MFQRDYILRMIEQMSGMLGRLAGLKEQKKYGEALALILDDWFTRLSLPNGDMLRKLSAKQIIELLSANGQPQAEVVAVVATLFKEEGELRGLLGQEPEGTALRRKALQLQLALLRFEPDAVQAPAVVDLANSLGREELAAEERRTLLDLYESEGDYARAEDVLFELLEETGDAELAAEGMRMYRRLLDKDDAELEAGNLPRGEVEEALRQLAAEYPPRM